MCKSWKLKKNKISSNSLSKVIDEVIFKKPKKLFSKDKYANKKHTKKI